MREMRDEEGGKLSLRMISLQTVDGMIGIDDATPSGYHNLVEEGSAKKGKRNPSRAEPFGTPSLGALMLDGEKTIDMADEGYAVRTVCCDLA